MDASSILDQAQPSVPIQWVERLFSRMQACYGNRFLDMFANANMDDVKVVWGQQMYLLTKDELCRGVAALMTRDWPPSLPEFVKLCKPAIDAEVAYYEALEQGLAREEGRSNTWSSPAIYWAWRTIGGFEFRSQSFAYLKHRWSKVLADEIAKGTWPPIPETTLQLGVDMKSTDIAGRGVAELDKALHRFQSKSLDPDVDHLYWAKEIVRKVKQGESVPLIAEKMALEVLSSRRTQ
jgi:hypothetical protein